MNRFEFMRQLEELLADISPNEKEEALTYYNDYFNDAGEENEQQVIKDLESPQQVAEVVKEGLGFGKQKENDTADGTSDDAGGKVMDDLSGKKRSVWQTVCMVLGLIFCSPLILAVALTAFSIVFAAAVIWFSLLFTFGVMALACYLAALVFVVVGFILFPVSGFLALAMIGLGAGIASLGVLIMIVTVLMTAQWTPALLKWFCRLFRKIFQK